MCVPSCGVHPTCALHAPPTRGLVGSLRDWQVLIIVTLQERRVGRIVQRHDDGLLFDADVSFQALKEIAGQMSRIPLRERQPQTLPQLVKGALGDQNHAQMTIADIQVERSVKGLVREIVLFSAVLFTPIRWQQMAREAQRRWGPAGPSALSPAQRRVQTGG